MNQVGAVVVFAPGVTKDEATKFLKDIASMSTASAEHPDAPPAFELVDVGSFNPEHGSPVLYVP